MKKQDAQSIGEIIDRVLKEQNLDLKLDETRLIKAWNSLLGEQVASYTTKLYIQWGVLYVHLIFCITQRTQYVPEYVDGQTK